jgi:hypothetical protein
VEFRSCLNITPLSHYPIKRHEQAVAWKANLLGDATFQHQKYFFTKLHGTFAASGGLLDYGHKVLIHQGQMWVQY